MKKKLPIIVILIIFVAGVAVLSYPLVSAVINNIESRGKATAYMNKVESMPDPEIEQFFDGAETYNESLINNVILTDPFDAEAYAKIGANYEETLDTDGNGLIGYVDIPKINVYLPIYHGTSLEVLQKGAGHLENTSLPIGGKSTHSVISAHSAFPTQTFFDYLTELDEGDAFYIHVLNRTLKYEVDRKKVVLPEETSDLNIIEEEDHVTLLTCTPYSINTHRLLVRGVRVADDETSVDTSPQIINAGEGSFFFMGYELPYWEAALIIGAVIGTVVLIAFIILKRNKKKRKHLNNSKSENKSAPVPASEDGDKNET